MRNAATRAARRWWLAVQIALLVATVWAAVVMLLVALGMGR